MECFCINNWRKNKQNCILSSVIKWQNIVFHWQNYLDKSRNLAKLMLSNCQVWSNPQDYPFRNRIKSKTTDLACLIVVMKVVGWTVRLHLHSTQQVTLTEGICFQHPIQHSSTIILNASKLTFMGKRAMLHMKFQFGKFLLPEADSWAFHWVHYIQPQCNKHTLFSLGHNLQFLFGYFCRTVIKHRTVVICLLSWFEQNHPKYNIPNIYVFHLLTIQTLIVSSIKS